MGKSFVTSLHNFTEENQNFIQKHENSSKKDTGFGNANYKNLVMAPQSVD
jgi:hypothetical protein